MDSEQEEQISVVDLYMKKPQDVRLILFTFPWLFEFAKYFPVENKFESLSNSEVFSFG